MQLLKLISVSYSEHYKKLQSLLLNSRVHLTAMESLAMKAKDTDSRSLLYIQSLLWSFPGSLAALQSLGTVNIDLTASLGMTTCSHMPIILISLFIFYVFN